MNGFRTPTPVPDAGAGPQGALSARPRGLTTSAKTASAWSPSSPLIRPPKPLGLKPGDVITDVDGQGAVPDSRWILDATGRNVTLTLEGGERRSLILADCF